MAPKKLSELSVRDLKRELDERDCDTTGLKATLRNRLEEALRNEGEDPEIFEFVDELEEFANRLATSLKEKLFATCQKLEKPKEVLNNADNLKPTSLERFEEEKRETVVIVEEKLLVGEVDKTAEPGEAQEEDAGSLESEFATKVNKLEEEIKMPTTPGWEDVLNNVNNFKPTSLERSVEEKRETVVIVEEKLLEGEVDETAEPGEAQEDAGSLESEFVTDVGKLEHKADPNLVKEIIMPITLKLENEINDENTLRKLPTEAPERTTLTTIKLSPFNEKMSSVKAEKMELSQTNENKKQIVKCKTVVCVDEDLLLDRVHCVEVVQRTWVRENEKTKQFNKDTLKYTSEQKRDGRAKWMQMNHSLTDTHCVRSNCLMLMTKMLPRLIYDPGGDNLIDFSVLCKKKIYRPDCKGTWKSARTFRDEMSLRKGQCNVLRVLEYSCARTYDDAFQNSKIRRRNCYLRGLQDVSSGSRGKNR